MPSIYAILTDGTKVEMPWEEGDEFMMLDDEDKGPIYYGFNGVCANPEEPDIGMIIPRSG